MNLKPIASNMTELNINKNGVEYSILFSYQTPVAFHQAGIGYAKTNKYWSPTTSRHISKWLKLNGFDASRGDGLREVDQETLNGLVK